MNHLAIENLTKSFGPVKAIVNFSATLTRGDALGLFGPSGCGKTTLLRLLAGLEHPDTGSIHIDDRQLCGNGNFVLPRERNTGMVFQDLALWPHMTAGRQIEFVLRESLPDRTARKARLEELLTRTHLIDRRNHRPADLSGGEAQRLALARAIAQQPGILLLDEPFAHLDATLRDTMVAWLNELRGDGLTILLASHDPADHQMLCERTITMHATPYEIVNPSDLTPNA